MSGRRSRQKGAQVDRVNCLGIDPGSKTAAIACIEPMRSGGAWGTWVDELEKAKALIRQWGTTYCTHAVIESGFHRGRSTPKLDEARGVLKYFCKEIGLEVVSVDPNQWQFSVLNISPSAKRDERKAAAMFRAKAETRIDDLTQDEADAVCLAIWGNATLRLEAKAETYSRPASGSRVKGERS